MLPSTKEFYTYIFVVYTFVLVYSAIRKYLQFLRLPITFIIAFSVLHSCAYYKANAAIEHIKEKNGRFYCPPGGKLLVYGTDSKIVCKYRGKMYNALNGKLFIPGAEGASTRSLGSKNGSSNRFSSSVSRSYSRSANNGYDSHSAGSYQNSDIKRTYVVNNFYDEKDVGPSGVNGLAQGYPTVMSANNNAHTTTRRKRPLFSNISLGMGPGVGFLSLNSDFLYIPGNGTNDSTKYNLTTNQYTIMPYGAFLLSGTYQFNKHFAIGMDLWVPIASSAQNLTAPVYNTPEGQMPPLYISKFQPFFHFAVRAGYVMFNTKTAASMAYLSIGGSIAGFYQQTVNAVDAEKGKQAVKLPASWNPLESTSIGIFFSAGVEFILFTHLSLRVAYMGSFFPQTTFSATSNVVNGISTPNGQVTVWNFGYKALVNNVVVIVSYAI